MTERLLGLLMQQAALISAGIVTLALLRPLLRRLGAAALYASWLLLPLLALTPALPRPGTEPLPLVLQATGAPAHAARPALPATPEDLSAWVLAAWLAGTVAWLAVQARRQWALSQLGTRLPAGSSPALVGLLRPRVALPTDFEQRFPPAQRALILAHEEVHRDRWDNLWNLLACAIATLHWWNPLVAWAARRLRADQELACDAAVLSAHPGARHDYTRALLTAHQLHHLGAPLASRWGTTHPLVERIAMLNRPRPLSRLAAAGLAAIALAASGVAYAVQSAEAAPDAPLVELKLDIRYRTGTAEQQQTLSSQPTLRIPFGGRATVLLGGTPQQPSAEQLAIVLTAQDAGNDKIELRAEVSKGDPLTVVSRPRLITRNGVKALIEQGRDDPGTVEHLSLAITPTRLAAAKP